MPFVIVLSEVTDVSTVKGVKSSNAPIANATITTDAIMIMVEAFKFRSTNWVN